ncbi:MAG: hypothetical protein Q7R99_04035 [bacterium]|nr:hypothetical protein [bacterium]
MNQIKNIVFPENNIEITEEILNNFRLTQTEEEAEKLHQSNAPDNAFILRKLIKKVGTVEISFEKFIEELSLQLKIETPKAQQIAQEVKIKILDHKDNLEIQTERKEPLRVQEKVLFPEQKRTGPDDYREPVE